MLWRWRCTSASYSTFRSSNSCLCWKFSSSSAMWSVMAWCGKRFPSMCGVNCSWSASATTVGGWDGASTVCWLLFAAICCKFLCSSTSAFLWFRRSISVFVFGVSVQSTKSLFCAVVAGPCPKFNCCIVMWHYVCRVLHLAWVCWCHLLVWRLGNSALWASVAEF